MQYSEQRNYQLCQPLNHSTLRQRQHRSAPGSSLPQAGTGCCLNQQLLQEAAAAVTQLDQALCWPRAFHKGTKAQQRAETKCTMVGRYPTKSHGCDAACIMLAKCSLPARKMICDSWLIAHLNLTSPADKQEGPKPSQQHAQLGFAPDQHTVRQSRQAAVIKMGN